MAPYWKFTCTAAITSYKSYQNSATNVCSYYQFHSRAGKMKIKNVNLWNYVTQTVTYLYEQEEKTNQRFRVQPVSSSLKKLLWRGRTRGWRNECVFTTMGPSRFASSAAGLLLVRLPQDKPGLSAFDRQDLAAERGTDNSFGCPGFTIVIAPMASVCNLTSASPAT